MNRASRRAHRQERRQCPQRPPACTEIRWSIELEAFGGHVGLLLHPSLNGVPASVTTLLLQRLAAATICDGADRGMWRQPQAWQPLPPAPPGTLVWYDVLQIGAKLLELGPARGFVGGDREACLHLLLAAIHNMGDCTCPPTIGMDDGRYTRFAPRSAAGGVA
jgi:hypothetical protein